MWKIGDSAESKGYFPVGNCIVRYSLTEKGNEIEVYNPVKSIYLDNVAEWLMLNVIGRETESSNEWNEHGFRDEQDYLSYKFG